MTNKEYKKVERNFVYSDIHFPEHNKNALECATKVMSDYKPHRIVLIGDALNMSPVSHWMEDKKLSLENKRLLKDYEGFNAVLKDIKKRAGKQLKEVVYLIGNHEDWVNQYIDKNPQVQGMLEVENNIKLEGVKLTFVKFNSFYKIGKLYMTHGLYTNQYHASKMVNTAGKSVMYGHTHDVQVSTKMGLLDDDKHQAYGIGCLCDMSPDYMRNRPNNWVHAFATVDVLPNGNFSPQIINIVDKKVIYNGKIYKG